MTEQEFARIEAFWTDEAPHLAPDRTAFVAQVGGPVDVGRLVAALRAARTALQDIQEVTLTATSTLDLAARCHNIAKHALAAPGAGEEA